ncbi:calcium/sodium antiporter [Morganella psychrotolerans]|uniref:Calcium/sodium antiporter n=1 Tax=Morganella psychrotolerans TaxID=368603 RepID=A0A5M9R5Q6_9GAMM|nr:calcium/sodium antiporter [Morganella psychrotolerans]KAA8715618.1 calcium/sodium antiporter [Morganella psychrotolerans]OBU05653.1 calcium/sodium antiporter [Morganella psychrotolerans]
MLLTCILLLIGLILLVYASDRIVYSAAIFSRALGISPFIIGIVVAGLGTSLPELIISAGAVLEGQPALALGTIIGSNITNLLLIAGLAALIRPMSVQSAILRRELPIMLAVMALFGLFIWSGGITRIQGGFLLLAGLASLWLVVKIASIARRDQYDGFTTERNHELPQENSLPIALLWLVAGLLILPVSVRIVIDNAVAFTRYAGISGRITGLTILAIGTSLPELCTTIAAAVKGEKDIALGNLIGSTLFNITIVAGIPAILAATPMTAHSFVSDFWVMIAASILFVLFSAGRKQRLNRLKGIILLGGFIAWLTSLFMGY